MISGTSTGSLLTTALVLPNNDTAKYGPRKNLFFAVNASEIYSTYGKDVFKTFKQSTWVHVVGTIIFSILGGILGFCFGKCYFHDKEHEETMKSFYELIDKIKEERKKRGEKGHDVSN